MNSLNVVDAVQIPTRKVVFVNIPNMRSVMTSLVNHKYLSMIVCQIIRNFHSVLLQKLLLMSNIKQWVIIIIILIVAPLRTANAVEKPGAMMLGGVRM